jgi:hypothetical protein
MTDFGPLLLNLRALQGEVTIDGRHCYRKAKKTVPGVTTVIGVLDKPALTAWKVRVQVEGTARAAWRNPPPQLSWADEEHAVAAEVNYVDGLVALAKEEFEHERIANAAADVGTQVHALIEHAVREQLGQPSLAPEASDEALFIFAGWREWAKRVKLEPLMAEGRIHHPSLNYCGTFDLLAKVEGRPAVLDWKPQARVYPERRLQSAAYREALHAMGWPNLDGYIVSMPRDGREIGTVRLETGEALAATFAAFLNCLSLYRWLRQVQKDERSEAA